MDFHEQDYLNGDHSFKMWFKIMWQNQFIQTFIGALVLAILFIIYYDGDFDWIYVVALSIPVSAMVLIAYKGFYQFWDDLKNGRSR